MTTPRPRFRVRFGFVLALLLFAGALRTVLGISGFLDPTFDSDGILMGARGDTHGIAIQPDGKIVVVGLAWENGVPGSSVTRFNADGTLDPAYSGNGTVDTTYRAEAVVVDPAGRIVVAGSTPVAAESDFALARYNANGTPDTSFGLNGRVNIDFAGSIDRGYDLALDATGRIVVAGSSLGAHTYDFAVARLESDGSLDPTFDRDGKVTTDLGPSDLAYAVAVETSGAIVVSGSAAVGSSYDFAVARYHPDGSLDLSFGGGAGVAFAHSPGTREIGEAMALDATGAVIVAGWSGPENSSDTNDVAVVRFKSDGTLDPAFGANGMVTTDFLGMEDEGQAVAVDSVGRIVVFGRAQTSPEYGTDGYALALLRYLGDGTLDPGFGIGGKVTTLLRGPMGWWGSVAMDAAGRIVVAGTVNNHVVLARYFGAESAVLSTIDIRPGDPDNIISLSARGKVQVAILSTPDFMAPAQIDSRSLTFGRTGDEPSLLPGKNGNAYCEARDVNDDTRVDLVCSFLVKLTAFQSGDSEGVLKGMTVAGALFEDRDRVRVTP